MPAMTAEELLYVPDVDCLHELVRGELVRRPFSTYGNSVVAGRIVSLLYLHVAERDLGSVTGPNTGYILTRNPDTVLAPKVAFTSKQRLPPDHPIQGYPELGPDLVVLIPGPTDLALDLNYRIMLYLQAGTKLVWVVDPEVQIVTTYQEDLTGRILVIGETLSGFDVVPGFDLPLSELFDPED